MRTLKKINLFISAATLVLLVACGHSGPETININKDDCDNCKMSISDKRFACELVTEKGRAYKFDDVTCMMSYKNDAWYALMELRDYLGPEYIHAIDRYQPLPR